MPEDKIQNDQIDTKDTRQVSDRKKLDDILPPHFEEVLTIRVVKGSIQYILILLGLIAAIIGLFGLNFKSSFDEVRKKVEEDKQAITQKNVELSEKIEEANRIIQDLKEFSGAIDGRLKDSDDYLKQIETRSENTSISFAEKFGAYSYKVDESAAKVQEATRQATARLNAVDQAIKRAEEEQKSKYNEMRAALNLEQRNTLERIEQAQQNNATLMKGQLTAFEQRISGLPSLQQKVDKVESKLFGSGSYVIREKRVNPPIKTVPKDANQDIRIDVSIFDHDKLYAFKILDVRGNLLFGPKDLVVGDEIHFTNGNYVYSLTARYTLDLTWGTDVAGIDLTWISLSASVGAPNTSRD